MNRYRINLLVVLAVLCTIAALAVVLDRGAGNPYVPQNGDLIFQTSNSLQSRAVQIVTHSPLSHMGIVFMEDGGPRVFEAVGPVKSTPLATWINRGVGRHFTVKRLRDAESLLTPDALSKMREVGESFQGKPYDVCFEWSDKSIYCSELVWKIYDQALGLQVGSLDKLGSFDLNAPEVEEVLAERKCRLDPEERVISPVAMFDSGLLILVHEE